MKLAGAKALAFCERPPKDKRIALIFGVDPGLTSAAADALAKTWMTSDEPINLVRLTDDDVRRDPGLLTDELMARSLLGGERLVRMRVEREAGAGKHAVAALAAIDAGDVALEARWILEAGDLGRSSALRAAFEASPSAAALQLYADDADSIAELTTARLKAGGAQITPDALAAFIAELPGDRRLALSEIDKLELYAMGLGRPIAASDVALLASAEQPKGADDAADAAIAGDALAAGVCLDRFLDAGGTPISAMRTLHFRLLRAADAAASGASSGMRLRPPVFDRDWPAFAAALKAWPAAALHRALAGLYAAELSCKRAGAPSEAIVRHLIDEIAQRKI